VRETVRLGRVNKWDERYAATGDALWSGRANGVLVAELNGQHPGCGLDVGWGEGGDAIWLARKGWEVTGVDVSAIALKRAVAAARAAAVTVDWICADIGGMKPAPRGYDLVSVHYPALRHGDGEPAIHALLDATATSGTLLIVGHAPLDPEWTRATGLRSPTSSSPTTSPRTSTASGRSSSARPDRGSTPRPRGHH
jgi:SAM-dependent methyltransferase